MTILGMSPLRLVVGGAGAHIGVKVTRDSLLPMLAQQFPNLVGAPKDSIVPGVADVLIGAGAVVGAALANKLFSNVSGS
jgi:hypothetical protein